MPNIEQRIEQRRGCGYRQPGGKYVVAGKPQADCGRLPIPLTVCPTCNTGIKAARGWTWFNPEPFILAAPECDGNACDSCPVSNNGLVEIRKVNEDPARCAGLIWIGEKFYATPEEFLTEAGRMGISRRIKAIPRGFEVGKTWVFLAHRKAIPAVHESECATNANPTGECDCEAEPTPGIFSAFRPDAIEYIVKGTEDEAELDKLENAGFTLIHVTPANQHPNLFTRETLAP